MKKGDKEVNEWDRGQEDEITRYMYYEILHKLHPLHSRKAANKVEHVTIYDLALLTF